MEASRCDWKLQIADFRHLEPFFRIYTSTLLSGGGVNGKESEPEVLQIWLKAQKWPTMTFGAIFSIFLHLHLGIVYVGGGMVEEVDVEAFRCD